MRLFPQLGEFQACPGRRFNVNDELPWVRAREKRNPEQRIQTKAEQEDPKAADYGCGRAEEGSTDGNIVSVEHALVDVVERMNEPSKPRLANIMTLFLVRFQFMNALLTTHD
jgi:hypothetical protein